MQIVIKDADDYLAGAVEVVHIYKNLRTEFTYVFTAEDFVEAGGTYIVVTTSDSGPGSLWQALTIANAISGGTIQSSLPAGSVIELTSVLPTIIKDITLERNGLTLTRASSWTTSASVSQLLKISKPQGSSSAPTVTIRRGYTLRTDWRRITARQSIVVMLPLPQP